MKRSVIVLGLVLLATVAALGIRWYASGADARRWERLSDQRMADDLLLRLPAIGSFVNGCVAASPAYHIRFAPGPNNTSEHIGVLERDGQYVGRCETIFIYDGWATEPCSVIVDLEIEPTHFQRLPTEAEIVLQQTRAGKVFTGTLEQCSTLAHLDDSGKLRLSVRTAWPSPWIGRYPETVGGDAAEFQTHTVPRARWWLDRYACNSPWQMVDMDPPQWLPPRQNPGSDGRYATGYLFDPGHPLVPISFGLGRYGLNERPCVNIRVGDAGGDHPGVSDEDLQRVFRADFLQKLRAEADFGGQGPSPTPVGMRWGGPKLGRPTVLEIWAPLDEVDSMTAPDIDDKGKPVWK